MEEKCGTPAQCLHFFCELIEKILIYRTASHFGIMETFGKLRTTRRGSFTSHMSNYLKTLYLGKPWLGHDGRLIIAQSN